VKTDKNVKELDDGLAFQLEILKSTHNPYVIKIGQTILQRFKASISKSIKKVPDTALREQKLIFEAFSNKDEKKLRQAIEKSFEGWMQILYEHSESTA